ncbi:MAG: MerR family transcriptional regulator [Candidatus Dormibacter sp.]
MTERPSLSVSEVGSMTGLSPHTIRAWERRHDAVQPKRSKTGQRQYTQDDVDFLIRVKQLTRARGLSLKLAVLEARGLMPVAEPPTPAAEVPVVFSDRVDEPWRSVADLMPYLVVLLDPRGRIVDASIPVARAVGRLRRELQGVRFIDLVEPYDRAKAARVYKAPLQQRRGWEINLKTRSLRGLFSFDCWPIRQQNRWLIACIGRDLNEAGLEFWPVPDEAAR